MTDDKTIKARAEGFDFNFREDTSLGRCERRAFAAGLAKGDADRAALVEARPYVQGVYHQLAFTNHQHVPAGVLARIDAALSAASGDRAKLKGDPDVDDYIRKEREKQARIVKGLHEYPTEGGSPAPSGEAKTPREKLDELLAGRPRPKLEAEDFGTPMLNEIDAPYAASGEASGDDVDLFPIPKAEFFAAVPRPAPSETPNVERATTLIKKLRLPSACCLKSKSAREWTGCPDNCTCPRSVEYEDILSALDSARAEGIAAERECAVKIAEDWVGLSAAKALAAAIREAKP